ncbi:uncharacterized protein LOC112184155 [Rosa chinensis]|uniref:uncharacterized protein LOC112184155 n=1 Tax=Rosa chinensis TaxID=74649 RepID=UPI000D088FB5|nr:uncharacterized protein LOC112184155 [Rosa chinensis]
MSGQQINYEKSCISFSKNVPRWKQDELASLLGVRRVDKHDKYLGLPTELSYSKDEAFRYLVDRVRKRTQGWRDKTLSTAGKEVLIKAVVQSIPTYVMNCFELPKHLCHEMHRLMARFWWGEFGEERKIHWVAWEKLCASKKEGGLGFRDMHLFNIALLAKQGWRLICRPDSLLAQVLKARYFPQTDFMQAELHKGASFTWRSILKGRDLLRKGLRFQVGNGENISVWNDPWVPLPYRFRPFSLPMQGTEEFKVADFIDSEAGAFWLHGLLNLQPGKHPTTLLDIWFWDMIEALDGEKLEYFLMALWVVWMERNNMVWKGSYFNIINMHAWATSFLDDYKNLHKRQGHKARRTPIKWSRPPRGRLKINIDGSFCADTGSGGVGVVVRNYEGTCMATFARTVQYAQSAIHMEAEALRAGLLIAIHQDWKEIEVESDCVNLVNALHVDGDDLSDIGRILDDCRSYWFH